MTIPIGIQFSRIYFLLFFFEIKWQIRVCPWPPIQIIDLRNNKRMIKFSHLIRTNETKIKRIDTMMSVQVLEINRKKVNIHIILKERKKRKRKMRVCNYRWWRWWSLIVWWVCMFRVVFFFVLNLRHAGHFV